MNTTAESDGLLSLNVEDTNDNPRQEGTSPYVRSTQFRELVACALSFVLLVQLPTLIIRQPNQRPFPYQIVGDDLLLKAFSNNEIFESDTVPDWLLVLAGAVGPLLVQIGLVVVGKWQGETHATLCVYFMAMGMTILSTNLIKLYVGYLRPAFFDLCEFQDDSKECDNNDHDARLSFPSGHASVSFCGLTLLTLFLHNHFGLPALRDVQDATTERFRRRYASIVSLFPMGVASFIAASRVVDNKHFPADVLGGSVLGASIANFVYSLWYPPPPSRSQLSHTAISNP